MKETYQDYGINLPINATGQHYTTCPDCSHIRKKSNDPCLGIDADRQIWNCNHCGWSGSLKNIKKEYNKPDWKPKDTLSPKVIEYFKKRGITEKTLKYNDIQYKDIYMPQEDKEVGAIAFPYIYDGEVVNIKYRDGKKNFRQESGCLKVFYGIDKIKKGETTVIICEGEIDKLSFDEIGYHFSISVPDGAPSPGTKNFNTKFEYIENCRNKLKGIENFILVVDNDEAGRVLERELAHRLGRDKCLRVEYPDDCKDANEILVKHGKEELKKLIANAKQYPVIGVNQTSEFHNELMNLYNNGFNKVYSTGWDTLDKLYKAREGELTVITGYSGHGKSEFVDALLVNLAEKHNWKFGVCSLENLPYERHIRKLAEKIIGKPFFKGESPRITEDELKEAEITLENKFYFINPEKIDIDNILEITKSLIFKKGIDGLLIDPFNELEHNRKPGISETEYIGSFLSKVRRFARMNNICIWIIAHPVKPRMEDRDKPPTVYDISGSANWANKADNAISVYRHQHDNLVEIHVQKIRFKEVGRIGMIELIYDNPSGCYNERPF
uniref:Putative DNA topoisomerase-primase n=1 Tax=viral metagenome TaxID=1070528 RepID=A0A6M3LH19_9ZZZZ